MANKYSYSWEVTATGLMRSPARNFMRQCFATFILHFTPNHHMMHFNRLAFVALLIVFLAVPSITNAEQKVTRKRKVMHPVAAQMLTHFARGFYGEEEADIMVDQNKVGCIACTLILGVSHGISTVQNRPIGNVLDGFCSIMPPVVKTVCQLIIDDLKPAIVDLFNKGETVDGVCKGISACDPSSQCHLFPSNGISTVTPSSHPYLPPIMPKLEIPVANHRPLVDLDGDGHSTIFPLRGYAWRGRDCNDLMASVHPGRKPVLPGDVDLIDSNCNGIYGFNAATFRSYEAELCEGTKPMGVAILGDSAAAHFAIPPSYINPLLVKNDTYKDILNILTNELDWPDMSATTGVHVSNWTGRPEIIRPLESFYVKNWKRNHCALRDYQNIAVNGARSGAMASKIVLTMGRNQSIDNPMIVNLALIGNDVCNGRHSHDGMTSPADMIKNTVATLTHLDTKVLPAGSKVVLTGLADGRVLYDNLASRIHPLGSVHKNVKYADFYDYMNCLETSPCWGWMNSNQTVRDLTAVRQRALNDALASIPKTYKFKNFDVVYIDDPFTAIIKQWVNQGGQVWQLIEEADGFHPSQTGNSLMSDYIWNWLEQNRPDFLPPVNPNNAKIEQLFGNQGGLS